MSNIEVKHTLPHRIRLKVPAVRNNEIAARRLEKYAGEIDGVYWVRTNTICAGLVVRFDSTMYTEKDIVALFMHRVAQGDV